jgi:calcium-dependent protein kinase
MLCGYPPFQGESNDDVFEAIRQGYYSCSGSDWRHISDDAKDLVKRHLTRDPSHRCTAKVALSHMWIEHQAPKAQNVSINGPNFMNNLRGFRSVNKLKKAAIHVVAGQLAESDIEQLRDLFLAMDKDGDGHLTAAEIREGLQRANVNVPADLQKVMESIDVDGSGCIDYTEFLAAALDQRTYAQEDLCWAAFNMFDKDGDGSISVEELARIIDGEVGETMEAGNVDELMQEVDTNGDGRIDFSEFMDMMRRADKKRKTTVDLTAVSAKLRQEADAVLKDNSSRRSCLNLAALASICSSRGN